MEVPWLWPQRCPCHRPCAGTKHASCDPAHTWVLTAENSLTVYEGRGMASRGPDCPRVLWVSGSDTKTSSNIKDVGVSIKDLSFKGTLWTFQTLFGNINSISRYRLTSVSALRKAFCTGLLLDGTGFLLEGSSYLFNYTSFYISFTFDLMIVPWMIYIDICCVACGELQTHPYPLKTLNQLQVSSFIFILL